MIYVGVHNGNFHADDVFAVAMLKMAHHDDVRIIRTRDRAALNKCNFVVDVGEEYVAEKGLFDHHQKGGAGVRSNGVPYASAGLVLKHFGIKVCGSQEIADNLDNNIIQKIDAADCGHAGYGLDRTYSAIISDFNPSWESGCEPTLFNEAFETAVDFAIVILANAISHATGKKRADKIVKDFASVNANNSILILDTYAPWQDTVVESMPDVRIVVFPDAVGSWKLQVAPIKVGGFANRCKLPAEWGGVSSEKLEEVTGIKGCIFTHIGLFIAGHQTKSGAIEMAELAIQSINQK